MYCKACGKVVPDDALYCPQCGAPLSKVDAGHARDTGNNGNYHNMSDKEREEMEFIQGRLNKGRLYGIISIVCSILGLGSFGSLDVVAIICGYLGLKNLKSVPNSYPDKAIAVTLNRAGIICSAGLIILPLSSSSLCSSPSRGSSHLSQASSQDSSKEEIKLWLVRSPNTLFVKGPRP